MVMMRPPLPRWAQGGLACDDRRTHVDVQQRVDVGERDVLEFAQSKNACIVDEDVEPAQFGDSLLDRGLNGGDVRAVRLDRHGSAPHRLDGADDLRGTLRGLLVGDRHIRAFGGKRLCDRCANTSACARHQSPFSRQRHRNLHFCSDRHRSI